MEKVETLAGISLVAFDLDDTLAPSKSPLPSPMAHTLCELLDVRDVCIISGGHFSQFTTQVLAHLPANQAQACKLHLMPTCGTRYFLYTPQKNSVCNESVAEPANWTSVYEHNLSDSQRAHAIKAVEETAKKLGLWEEHTWGNIIEDRGSQITFSALGQLAPLEEKKAWDPSGEKKNALAHALAPLVPDLDVHSGGSTSVDITLHGIDKAYGMRALMQQLSLEPEKVLFVGDRLDPAGNDFPVISTGVHTHEVSSWQETNEYISQLVKTVSDK